MYPAKISLLLMQHIMRILVYSKKKFNKKMPKLTYTALKK